MMCRIQKREGKNANIKAAKKFHDLLNLIKKNDVVNSDGRSSVGLVPEINQLNSSLDLVLKNLNRKCAFTFCFFLFDHKMYINNHITVIAHLAQWWKHKKGVRKQN